MFCEHLCKSEDAYQVDPVTQTEKPADVHICGYPQDVPERFVDMPRWLLKQVAGGQMVRPESDCKNCPAFKPRLKKVV